MAATTGQMMFVRVKAKVYSDTSGTAIELPVLLTAVGILLPLQDYFLLRIQNRSIAWMEKAARAVEMFMEYMLMNPSETDPRVLFQNFASRLYTGTFNKTTGIDPSELCWAPRSYNDAGQIIGQLTDFFEWLGKERPEIAKINPRYEGGTFDRVIDEAAYQFRRNKAFLGHTWAHNLGADQAGHLIRVRRIPKVAQNEPPAFPDERFEEFLFEGFKIGERFDFRGMLITLLLHGAGFRESEPFHLYVQDVLPDPMHTKQAVVLIHHPSQGRAPSESGVGGRMQEYRNRAEYLSLKYGLAPRNEVMGHRKSGWKGGIHDGKYYKRAYWFLPVYGEWFLQIWYRYLEQMAMIDRPHPYAFINFRAPIGQMYALAQYNKAHATACQRIGLLVGKALGTTPHGHRHAYGRRLTSAGIKKEFIRLFMHHVYLESQEPYTQATLNEMRAALNAGVEKLQEQHIIPSDLHEIRLNKVSSANVVKFIEGNTDE